MVQQSLMGQGLIIEASQSHSDTLHWLLDEWSAQHKDIYQITQHPQQTKPCLPTGFKPAIQASERPQTHALDHTATRIRTAQKYFTKCRLYILTSTNTHMSEVCTLVKCMCDAIIPSHLQTFVLTTEVTLYQQKHYFGRILLKKSGDSSLWLPPSKMWCIINNTTTI
jgi:hypothetical protein